MDGKNALTPADAATLRRIVTEACADMLASTGCAVRALEEPSPAPAPEHDIAGFIGFSGGVRGSLTIASSSKLFHRTHPHAGDPRGAAEMDLFDWTGEMANQILGRIKRRFCERGRDFDASTPTAIAGRDLGKRFPPRPGAIEVLFAVADEVVAVYFDLALPGDGPLFHETAEPIGCSLEGDLVMF